MNFFNKNIEDLARENENFRQEVTTGQHSQVVLMSLLPGEDIGEEVHAVDQTLVFVEGTGRAVLDGQESAFAAGSLVFVPAGTRHNFTNTGGGKVKLYTVYAPPEHKPGTVHPTKADAAGEEALEHA